MERIGVYPGSFDPVTNGHLDIIKRASKLFDKVYVVVSLNLKKDALFTHHERVDLLKQVTSEFENVEIEFHSGLIIDYVKSKHANAIVRGIRAISDFEHEFKLFSFNNDLASEIETVILLAKPTHLFLSSSDIKELAKFSGDISKYVPEYVYAQINKKYKIV
ncbi:pantetheine-phosphate adenylyltransferase [Haloplasma contractile]|uniref:Phosphopantetheine adenylyltransferase n=1 Tax=Haloplasma contractile SSD-17B TaxID=1033810 RepID=U2DTL8_9MOLU|nr:pantetheine-phosphate adenylyltransferase [Haloplasma contractile]ERJ11822.1 Phosphopantetheine adenylyltransferase protein [Haloplasma contractile SSD-17B]